MVLRVYAEKKPEFAAAAKSLCNDARSFLQIKGLKNVRIINRYDAQDIDEELFERCIPLIFSEPQVDLVYKSLPELKKSRYFIYEALPGQFDQRADSAQQCVQLLSCGERPLIKCAQIVVLDGELSEEDVDKIKKYVINPVEARETDDTLPETLKMTFAEPKGAEVLNGFGALDESALEKMLDDLSLSMDINDLSLIQHYFQSEKREPTLTEIRVLDTYWSDHCRHTTFNTEIEDITLEKGGVLSAALERYKDVKKELNRNYPTTLMDIATIGARYLKAKGELKNLDESEEINACSIRVRPSINGKTEDWLLMFKNETHNHPTEIEPFGGAATCIGGAIRDPLSGRSYVYQAMRVTGAADPLVDIDKTMKGKLPQRKIVTSAAQGYSSYGNQIGLATGLVDEIYHPGYAAKHMEIGMVIAAAPEENVVRKRPVAGDVVVLLGGKTGRDGCGGATGSSKSHDVDSLNECGSQVQKGNAPEERKLQRLFRNEKATKLIKRCNDFGAGGVSVAIGELADGLEIQLDKVPKKYEGLNATELAISESQERMAVVVSPMDVNAFCAFAQEENLEATVVAKVTDSGRLVMSCFGETVVDIARDFLNTNGASKYTKASAKEGKVAAGCGIGKSLPFEKRIKAIADDLNICSKRGLSERFDSTIGAASVTMPFGGMYQRTPQQSMICRLPVLSGSTDFASFASYGYNPFISEQSPYHGAYLAIVDVLTKLVASGADVDSIYLTLQEYFESMTDDPSTWGKPLSALLGALCAQLDLGVAAIGGKDSMSGSFEDMHVPPTLVAFGVGTSSDKNAVSTEFKKAGSRVVLLEPEYDGVLPKAESLKENFGKIEALIREGGALSICSVGYGGSAEAVVKMCAGNKLGFSFDEKMSEGDLYDYRYGAFVVELSDKAQLSGAAQLGKTLSEDKLCYKNDSCKMSEVQRCFEEKLNSVYPTETQEENADITLAEHRAEGYTTSVNKCARPKVLIPVFPGTNCEYDSLKAFSAAGAEVCVLPIRNLSSLDVSESVNSFLKELSTSQIMFLPGGFSAGDEPEGSGKFITAFLRNPLIGDEITKLLSVRDGLILGICNGFQALIKLGLVPFGEIRESDENAPTLTYNDISRHVSRLVRTKVVSDKSMWLKNCNVGDVYTIPVSHGEGKFVCNEEMFKRLSENGQITTQYVGLDDLPSMRSDVNPNGSYYAVEGITSPDGRVFGKMGHSERTDEGLYKNVGGNIIMPMFSSAVDYFK